VYTALYGGYDRLIEPCEQDLEVDWICFTDDPDLESATWQIVHDAGHGATPRLSSKWPKAVPHLALPNHRWTIWVDANMAVDNPAFAREALGFVDDRGIALFAHPQRTCIYDEARACQRIPQCRDLPVLEQVDSYRAEHPRRWGLYACGTIARDRDAGPVRALGEDWYAEMERWTPRDQLSFPVAARRAGVRPAVFPHHLHRHRGIDAVVCRLHRQQWFERLAERRDAVRPPAPVDGAVPAAAREIPWLVRLATGTNPWYELRAHRR
jgi:hypothetical protein